MAWDVNVVAIIVVNLLVVRIRGVITLVVGLRGLKLIVGLSCLDFEYQQ